MHQAESDSFEKITVGFIIKQKKWLLHVDQISTGVFLHYKS